MLVTCVEDGLTVGSHVYRKGEIFPLTGHLNDDMTDMSDEKIKRRQVTMYGKPYFRRSTNDEIEAAVQAKVVLPEQLDSRERKALGNAMQRKAHAYQDMTDVIKGAEEEIAQAEETVERIKEADEKAEAVKKPAKKKTTARKSTTRSKPKPKPEPVVEEEGETTE